MTTELNDLPETLLILQDFMRRVQELEKMFDDETEPGADKFVARMLELSIEAKSWLAKLEKVAPRLRVPETRGEACMKLLEVALRQAKQFHDPNSSVPEQIQLTSNAFGMLTKATSVYAVIHELPEEELLRQMRESYEGSAVEDAEAKAAAELVAKACASTAPDSH